MPRRHDVCSKYINRVSKPRAHADSTASSLREGMITSIIIVKSKSQLLFWSLFSYVCSPSQDAFLCALTASPTKTRSDPSCQTNVRIPIAILTLASYPLGYSFS